MRKHLGTIFFILLLFLFILFNPTASIDGAKDALTLWATAVLPSLMPFAIATGLLNASGVSGLIASWLAPISKKLFGFSGEFMYAFFSSALSGYPMGAKVTGELYASGRLSEAEATAIINCTSTSGPMFLMGTVAVGMLGNSALTPYLIYPHFLSAILLAMLAGRGFRSKPLGGKQKPFQTFLHQNPLQQKPFGQIFSEVIFSAIESMLSICGFMLIYNVFTNCLIQSALKWMPFIPQDILFVLLGVLEMTTGAKNAAVMMPSGIGIVVINFLIGFGGLSIHSQTKAIASKNGLKTRNFFVHKSIQGLLSAVFTILALQLAPLDTQSFSISLQPGKLHYITLGFILFSVLLALYAVYYITKGRKRARTGNH